MSSAPTAQSLPLSIEQALTELSTQLQKTCQGRLKSLLLYGGLARGSYHGARSDVNLMLVLDQADAALLQAIAPALTEARRKLNVDPIILEADEISRVADVFPVKILDIQRSHRLLAGEDLFGYVVIDPEHIRLHVEQALRNFQLRLRRTLAVQHKDLSSVQIHLQGMARPLALELRQLTELVGKKCGGEHTLEIYKEAAAALDLPLDGLTCLAGLREGEKPTLAPLELAGKILQVLASAVKRADQLSVKEA